jgi:DNA-binding response OmpR family regulator
MESKILIVDDERSVLQHVKTLLNTFGYKSGYIPRAELLVKRLENESFDLILLDINMPGIDGITALKQLKKHSLFKDILCMLCLATTNCKMMKMAE